MRHFFALIMLIVVIKTAVISQISIGLQGGLNIATPEITPIPVSTSSHVGLVVGAISEIRLSDVGFLQVGLSYCQQRIALDSLPSIRRIALDSLPSTWKIDYLEIPVLFKARLFSMAFKPYFLCGPAIGFSLSSSH